MRSLEEIEKDLEQARSELANARGKPAEVYSRIVGYYRSVRNWNKGKREEFKERRLYEIEPLLAEAGVCTSCVVGEYSSQPSPPTVKLSADIEPSAPRMLLFVKNGCPACPDAKAAAGRLGIPVNTIDTMSEDGLAEASRRNVTATPTAILLNGDGEELSRVRSSSDIASLQRFVPSGSLPEYKRAASM
ncbi:MAG: hypothetical protein LBH18_04955 [Spirochaetaceae bacterium]|jgi:ribonucleoside-triphosphate reductase|nr:hypothetical protein [Spirochaetaceae bacterium]